MHNTAKTSLTHPLQIAELSNPKFAGQIGITFCPGKKQRSAYSGQWDRDLGIDLDAIREWGASAVVTLVEDHELEALAVPGMGDAVRARGMVWHHLPIRDVSVPGERFEAQWRDVGAELRQLVKSGSKVLVHCKGGLGRAGTIAARLLVELGVPSDTAVAQVRRVRPGAIETSAQLAYVLACKPMAESIPDTSVDAIRDRAIGALMGLAVGDAIGTTLEFKARDTYTHLTDMIGGGPFALKPGEWTDDTAMALALADSLYGSDDLDEADLMQRFAQWHEEGTYCLEVAHHSTSRV